MSNKRRYLVNFTRGELDIAIEALGAYKLKLRSKADKMRKLYGVQPQGRHTLRNVCAKSIQDKMSKKRVEGDDLILSKKLSELSAKHDIPCITTWKQGKFIDMPQYYNQTEDWKKQRQSEEKTIIRPGGGINNGLFRVMGAEYPDNITSYLQELGEILKQDRDSN